MVGREGGRTEKAEERNQHFALKAAMTAISEEGWRGVGGGGGILTRSTVSHLVTKVLSWKNYARITDRCLLSKLV